MKPINDICVVEKIDNESMSSGFYLPPPSENCNAPEMGRVVAIGDGGISHWGARKPMNVKVGDIILFKRNCGTKLRVDDKVYRCVAPWERIAVLEEVDGIFEEMRDRVKGIYAAVDKAIRGES